MTRAHAFELVAARTLLDASASDDVAVSKVEFHLTGAGFKDALVGVVGPTRFGWAFEWNTATVPSGTYTINSVAFDPAGNVGRSTDATITVKD